MRDPVTGVDYPADWVEKCGSRELLDLAERGLAVLTASGRALRRGFTTGTTAAAACKAAILSLENRTISTVSVAIPCGLVLDVPVTALQGRAECRKYAGDYPGDVTAGLSFVAVAEDREEGLEFIPGAGIGRFARDTPRFRKGTPAITAGPLSCILGAMEEGLAGAGLPGATVRLEVPAGREVAARTLNPRIGVNGGISVLGTTGLVEPWDDHLTSSVLDRVAAARHVVLTTGRTGLRYARLRYPDHEVVLVGSGIRDAIGAVRGEAILFGLPGLILRYIRPDILAGTGFPTVEDLSASDRFIPILSETLASFAAVRPDVQVVIINRRGEIIGQTGEGR